MPEYVHVYVHPVDFDKVGSYNAVPQHEHAGFVDSVDLNEVRCLDAVP